MTFDITDNGRTTLSVDREDAVALGYPEEAIAAAEAGVRTSAIKAECRRRIYAAASAETQMNMATAAAVVSAKTASNRSADESAMLAGLGQAIDWVAAMRGRVLELAANAELDFVADESWPALPDGARDVVAMF